MSIRPAVRKLLLLVMAISLLPGWVEIAENVEHLLHDGHLAHSEEHEDGAHAEADHPTTDEHGCTPMAHQCGCCRSMPAVVDGPQPPPAVMLAVTSVGLHEPERSWSSRALAPPTRPPIA